MARDADNGTENIHPQYIPIIVSPESINIDHGLATPFVTRTIDGFSQVASRIASSPGVHSEIIAGLDVKALEGSWKFSVTCYVSGTAINCVNRFVLLYNGGVSARHDMSGTGTHSQNFTIPATDLKDVGIRILQKTGIGSNITLAQIKIEFVAA